jgi:sodium-dependent phosphate cotransporter
VPDGIGEHQPKDGKRLIKGIAQGVYFLLLLYLFFFSIDLMSAAFKMGGRGFAEQLVATASDPLAGLIIGFFATSIIQSSSTTTTIVVGLVASGALTIPVAIPIVMGANIGTTTTNTIVSMGHVTRSGEFEKAFAASTVHDFFNVLAALTVLPIEVLFHPVERTAVFLEHLFEGAGGMSLASPLKLVFFALSKMMKTMRGAVLDRLEGLFSQVLFRNDAASFTLGMVTTAAVQSSSATTSLVVPLAGTGVLSLRQIYPYTLGANIGTTITAILASFSTLNPAAVTGDRHLLSPSGPTYLAGREGRYSCSQVQGPLGRGDCGVRLGLPGPHHLRPYPIVAGGRIAMWKDLLTLFRGGGLCEEAFDEALLMLDESHGMFRDAIAALRKDGTLAADIYERDQQLNKYERSVGARAHRHRHRYRAHRRLHEEHRRASGGARLALRRVGAGRRRS